VFRVAPGPGGHGLLPIAGHGFDGQYQSDAWQKIDEIMDRDQTADRWLTEATPTLRRVKGAERRFLVSLALNEVTMLAASDELASATRDARAWLTIHACPDVDLGSRVIQTLKTCAEVALTAQQAITHPSGNMDAVLDRLSNLLAIIEVHTYALDNW
jgi:hypothetical protein